VAVWVPSGAIFVLRRGMSRSCVAVGSNAMPRALYFVAMVVCQLGTL
jgi:hypothetical protein